MGSEAMPNHVIDCHVHYGSPDDPQTGCYWSETFEKTPAFLLMRVVTKSLFRKLTVKRVQKVIFDAINTSDDVDQTVLLALDEVYDLDGTRHKEWSHMYIPNTYIAQLSQENDRILFGASVHPYREDWETELDFCIKNGAVLVKWVPSSQQINPSHEKCLPFYKKLAEHNLPLLCHAGPEYAIPSSDESFNKFNNPKYLEKALDLGVTVIIAHCALPYWGKLEDEEYVDDYKDFRIMMDQAEDKGWKLYADLSADASTFRSKLMPDIVREIQHDRLLFGSDYPIPSSIFSYSKIKKVGKWIGYIFKQVIKEKNPLDKNYKLINKMGFDPVIYDTAGQLFAKIKRP
jgi:mannonate dehydratase